MSSDRNLFEMTRLQNLTTDFDLLKNVKAEPIEIIEYDERSIAFHSPAKTCTRGMLLNLTGRLHFSGRTAEFLATGKVVECLDVGDDEMKYTVDLHRFDPKLWENFRNAVRETQVKVDKLFQSMREAE